MAERTHSPEQAASQQTTYGDGDPLDPATPMRGRSESQRSMVRASLEAERKPDVHRRRYRPGEVEEIAVAAVVRDALWKVATRMEGDPTIEQLVDEAAMSAARVMARVAATPPTAVIHSRLIVSDAASTTLLDDEPRALPGGWRGRLANVERHLASYVRAVEVGDRDAEMGVPDANVTQALAEVRSLLDFE